MKVKHGFVMSAVGEDHILVPTGDAAKTFHGLVRLNDTGAEIWKGLEKELSVDEIVNQLMARYTDVDRETVENSVLKAIGKFKDAGLLE